MAVANEQWARRVLADARERWGELGDWWLRDAEAVRAWLEALKPEGKDCVAVDIGNGCVAWLRPLGGYANVDCRGIGLGTAGDVREWHYLHKGMPAGSFVPWFEAAASLKAEDRAAAMAAVKRGDRLCLHIRDSKEWRLGMCLGGSPLKVRLELEGGEIELAAISDKWFVPKHRTAAFESLWDAGRVSFPNYVNMLAILSKKQKKLDPDDYAAGKRKKGKM